MGNRIVLPWLAAVGALSACDAADPATGNMAEPAAQVAAPAPASVESRIDLPDSGTAARMARPVVPARLAADCPSSDPCEFGRRWRACEAVPVYREPRDGAAVLRSLAAMETFVAEGGQIELVAPGKIALRGETDRALTGGLLLAKSTIVEAYGPLQGGRALYYDPNSGKGWSPPAAADHFWWDGKGEMLETPKMRWWVAVRLAEGAKGWLRLKSTSDAGSFPMLDYAEAIQAWDIDLVRDDETPDCARILRMRAQG